MDTTKTALPKTDKRILKTKAALQKALVSLLATQELSKITISAIAIEAHVNRKTFYLHYHSVEELFDEMVTEHITEVIEVLKRRYQQDTKIYSLTSIASELCVSLHHNAADSIEIYEHIPLAHVFELAIVPLKEAIIEQRKLRHLPDIPDIEFYLRFALAGAFSIYQKWLTEDTGKPLDEVREIVREVTAHGLHDILND